MLKSVIDVERIKRYFRGEYSESDAAYVNELFFNKTGEKDLRDFMQRQFYESVAMAREDEKDLDHILFRIHYEMNNKQQQRKNPLTDFIRVFSRIAAILILPLLIFSGIYFFRSTGNSSTYWVEIKAPAWTRAQFSLPDGTNGWLNSNSKIRYDGNYLKDRKVTLDGEAYFDVTKDEKKPFIVSTNEICVKVLGTKFNIASYENENDVEVMLEEGKLMFFDKSMNRSYMMNPNDLVVYDKTTNNFSASAVEPKKYSSWTEGKLVFRNDALDVIARRLERWYNVEVEVIGRVDRDPRLRATFKDETLEEVLSLLNRSLKLDYKIEDRNLSSDGTYAKKKVLIAVKPR